MQLCAAVQGAGPAGRCRCYIGQVSSSVNLHVDSASPSRAATHPGSCPATGRLEESGQMPNLIWSFPAHGPF